ncbi:unnamed protein product [Prorocentrum cordatum]|uniref:Uncharacterized protein n=1 Tax=Prorocentrum cordatum TaxID=2364126 RepID=A0ABN9U9Q9_9DINO|nr:unnamed protein product [Polarella glacialis]
MRPAGEAEASQASLRQALETARGLLDRRHHSLSRRPQVTGWQVAVPVLVAALFLGPWVLGRQGAPSRRGELLVLWEALTSSAGGAGGGGGSGRRAK